MNNKDLIRQIRAQKPEIPDSLNMRIHDRLARLTKEEQAMKKRVKFQTVLIAAIVFVMLMSTAFALGYSHLMDYLGKGHLKPIDGAEKLVQSDFGDAFEQGDVIFQVEEAIYDGKTAVVQMLITPVDPEKIFLLHQGIQDTPEDVYEVEYIEDDYGGEYRKVTGRKDGKKIIAYSLSLKAAEENTGCIFESNTLDGEELSDGSIRVWMEGSVISGAEDKLDLLVRSTYAPLEKMDNFDERYVFEKRITLTNSQQARHIAFEMTENNMDERVQVLSVEARMYPLRGEIAIEYAYEENIDSEPMGITFKLYSGEEEIAIGDGELEYLETLANGKKLYRDVSEIEAFADFPKTIVLEAKVIGQPLTLGQVTFSAAESENHAENRLETKKAGLYFAPNGNWKGTSVTLLKGEIYTGRKIALSYAYDGDRMNLPNVRFIAPDGTSIGEIVNQTTVIKKDSYEMEATLSGSGWPNEMTVEFVLNEKMIDSFDCVLFPVNE